MPKGSRGKLFSLSPERKNELWGIALLAGSLFLFMSLISYHPDDLPFFTSHPSAEIRNFCGVVGAFVAGLVRSGIGWTSYLLAILGFLWAAARFQGKRPPRPGTKLLSVALFLLSASSLLANVGAQELQARVYRGGVLGVIVGNQAIHYFGGAGAFLVLLTLSFLAFLLVTELAAWSLLEKAAGSLQFLWAPALRRLKRTVSWRPSSATPIIHVRTSKKEALAPPPPLARPEPPIIRTVALETAPRPPAPRPRPPSTGSGRAPIRSEPAAAPASTKAFQLPPLEILNSPEPSALAKVGKEWIEANVKVLEESLREFGIEAKVAEVEMGPVITRYEIEPAPGIKVQKITTLSDDLALVLKAPSVRIIAPIPGKARVGIEVPNPATSLVTLREILESGEFKEESSKLALAIGKDAAGHPLLADLVQMPHLLIAGTTGSGKTVCMNALISSLLFRATPEEVRFLMVDPKMVELSVFNGIPHLILPVLTDPKKVPLALAWVVQEMETRYRLFARLGLRNIEAYHQKQAQGQLPDGEVPENLPYLVIIIDELADLMIVAQAEVEKTIARLAHLSRATGIHMVLATQRPSVDVLTGVIKANFPARISFQVASKVDSRTVLDVSGADKLLGKGDLLFLQPGTSKLIRAQGTLVTDPEIERLVQFLKAQRQPEYDLSILESETAKFGAEATHERDSLYPEAVRVVVETGQASVSLLQRRMRLGYGRAARILDQMEEEGIVGPIRGARPREVYLKEVPVEYDDRSQTQIRA